jgi:polysaccharide pyruvyl transferase WcaK-like protein/MoaA/NifB/PqqE/SkfB family radical SAM enzyme
MHLIDQLRFRWWEWADARPDPHQRLPTVIQFPVNDICNSQCQMCHIWKRKRDHEITPAELAGILQNPLFREVRDVGINGGEPTLRKDLGDLAHVLLTTLPRLRSVSLITNAIQERNILRAVDELGRRCKDSGVQLSVMVSIDGVGDVHDRVRGVPGNFASADRVLDGLITSPVVGSCLIGCTLIRENIFNAEQVLWYARTKPVYARFRVGIPHRRLYTDDLRDPFDLDDSERFHLACFLDELRLHYETNPARRDFYLSLRNQLIYDAPRVAGCAWKNRGVTLTSRGELAYCAVESPILGSLLEDRADDLYWNKASVLQEINERRCGHCMHDYDGLQSRRILLERTLRKSLRRLPLGSSVFDIARQAYWAIRDRAANRRARRPIPSPVIENVNGAGKAVLLSGWYGTETLGDKAILAGLLSTLREAGWHGPVDLASLEPFISHQTTREMPGLGLRHVETVENARKRIAQGAYQLVAIAGGPLMSPVAEIFDLLGLFTEAAHMNAVRAVMGCGIGPLGYSRRRDSAIARLLALSHVTVVRDQASLDEARRRLGFAGGACVAPDPAFIWAARQMATSPIAPAGNGSVLLALREWQIREYGLGLSSAAAARMKVDFERELVEMVKELRRRAPDWKLRPLAMNTYARGIDDRLFLQRLFADHPDLLEVLGWKRVTPAEDFDAFRNARAVVAMRFHSVVLAIAAGVPHVAIDYTRGGKIAALLSAVRAEPPLSIETFSGKRCADQLLQSVQRRPPVAPVANDAYVSAWRKALAECASSG